MDFSYSYLRSLSLFFSLFLCSFHSFNSRVACCLLFLGSQLDCMGIMEQHVFMEFLFSVACTKVLGRMMGTRPRSSTEEGE